MQDDYRFILQQPQMSAPKPKRPYKMITLIAVLAFIVVGMAAALGMRNRQQPVPDESTVKPSITMYYRDAKTVLWSSATGNSVEAPAPTFAAYAKNELVKNYGAAEVNKGEWKIVTSLDYDLQQSAIEQVAAQKDELAKRNAQETVFIAEDATSGEIVSWVNTGADAERNPDETASRKIEPGTLMLPFVYASVLDTTETTINTPFDDAKVPLPGYPCTNQELPTAGGNCLYNFDRKYLGLVSVSEALAGVRLVPAIQAAKTLDTNATSAVNKIMTTAKKLGSDGACYSKEPYASENEAQCYQAALLGDGLWATPQSLVQAYAALVNGGNRAPQTPFVKVSLNDAEKTDWQKKKQQAVSERTATAITDILENADVSYLKSLSFAFSTPNGTPVGVMAGAEASENTFGAVQFASQYVAGFWTLGNGKTLAGVMETPVLTTTSKWLDTTR